MKLTLNQKLLSAACALFMGASVVGALYVQEEKRIQDQNMSYEMLSSFSACVSIEELSVEECEAIHG